VQTSQAGHPADGGAVMSNIRLIVEALAMCADDRPPPNSRSE
jgi:hypothetical protein